MKWIVGYLAVRCIAWLDLLYTECAQEMVQIRNPCFINKCAAVLEQKIADQQHANFRKGGRATHLWKRQKMTHSADTSPAFASAAVAEPK